MRQAFFAAAGGLLCGIAMFNFFPLSPHVAEARTQVGLPAVPPSGEAALPQVPSSGAMPVQWRQIAPMHSTQGPKEGPVRLQRAYFNPSQPEVLLAGSVTSSHGRPAWSSVWVQVNLLTKNPQNESSWTYSVPVSKSGSFAELLRLPFGRGRYDVAAAPPLTTNQTRLNYVFDTRQETKTNPFVLTSAQADSNQQLGMLSSAWADWTDPAIHALALQITKNARTPLEQARAVYDWEAKHIAYNWTEISLTSDYRWNTTQETLASRTGICVDYSNVADALMRSLGVPTQMLVGYASDSNAGVADSGNIGHSWNRSWIGGRWVYWDPTWSRYYLSKNMYFVQQQWFNPPMSLLNRTHQLKLVATQ